MQFKNAIMMQFHDHYFITFWTRPWVLKLPVWYQQTVDKQDNRK